MALKWHFRRRKQLALMLVLLLLSALTVRAYSLHVKSLKKNISVELTCEMEDDTPEDDDVHFEFTVPGNSTYLNWISDDYSKGPFPVEMRGTASLIIDRWIRFCKLSL